MDQSTLVMGGNYACETQCAGRDHFSALRIFNEPSTGPPPRKGDGPVSFKQAEKTFTPKPFEPAFRTSLRNLPLRLVASHFAPIRHYDGRIECWLESKENWLACELEFDPGLAACLPTFAPWSEPALGQQPG
jgi:hypothetical protein